MLNARKIMKKAADASAGLAVAVAFLNVALLVTELVKTVAAEEVFETADTAELEEND